MKALVRPCGFPQLEMDPLYGICHYIINCAHEAVFRGEVAGLANLPGDGAFLVAANHASHLDPPFIGAVIPHQLAFFARKTLWKTGVGAGWMDAKEADRLRKLANSADSLSSEEMDKTIVELGLVNRESMSWSVGRRTYAPPSAI